MRNSFCQDEVINLTGDAELLETVLTHASTPAATTILGAIVACASGKGKSSAFVATAYALGATDHAKMKSAWTTGIKYQLENCRWREHFMAAGGASGTRVHSIQRFAIALADVAFAGCQSLHEILSSKENPKGY